MLPQKQKIRSAGVLIGQRHLCSPQLNNEQV